jgi:hypothetical protein
MCELLSHWVRQTHFYRGEVTERSVMVTAHSGVSSLLGPAGRCWRGRRSPGWSQAACSSLVAVFSDSAAACGCPPAVPWTKAERGKPLAGLSPSICDISRPARKSWCSLNVQATGASFGAYSAYRTRIAWPLKKQRGAGRL